MTEQRRPPRPRPVPPGTIQIPLKDLLEEGRGPGQQQPPSPPPVPPQTTPATKIRELVAVELLGKAELRTTRTAQARASQSWMITRVAGGEPEELSRHVIPPAVVIGRGSGDIQLDDVFLSSPHARFYCEDGKLRVEDLGSTNGVFIRLRGPRPLVIGDVFTVGRQLLRLDPPDSPDSDAQTAPILGVVASSGEVGRSLFLTAAETVIGRASTSDIVFASDECVSARHAVIKMASGTPARFLRGATPVLQDLDSQNGTFVKAQGSVELQPGDVVNLGQQQFRVSVM